MDMTMTRAVEAICGEIDTDEPHTHRMRHCYLCGHAVCNECTLRIDAITDYPAGECAQCALEIWSQAENSWPV